MTSSRKPPAKHANDVQSARERREEAVKKREEIVKGIDEGRITRRNFFKVGLLTTSGMLAAGSGLGVFSKGAQAQVLPPPIPTGTPPSPAFGAQPFTQAMPRLIVQEPHTLTEDPNTSGKDTELMWAPSADTAGESEPNAKRLSWHTDFSEDGGDTDPTDPANPHRNPRTGRGPMEGRAPDEYFAHQRWEEYMPKVGYLMTIGKIKGGYRFHKNMPKQKGNSIWCFAPGGLYKDNGKLKRGVLAPPLIKMRYGEPAVVRVYNALPKNRAKNGDFGRNEFTIHNHNAHNPSASDGASNCHIFPGQFYDYHWGTTLARADTINSDKSEPRASGPDGTGGLTHIKGDFRELQSTLWFHDHRFFFTAENVYKGEFGMLNYYSGPDRGNEDLNDGVNHNLPSGTTNDWGNVDFDVNIAISDAACDPAGQYFFDIFNTDGFLGDLMMVNMKYRPFFKVLPRRYRFRLLCACMSRFIKLVLVDENDNKVPFKLICNDGNFLNQPLELDDLDQLGVAERFDIVVDFKGMKGKNLRLVNVLEHFDGRGPEKELSVAEALSGSSSDPGVGALLQFRVRNKVKSADQPGVTLLAAAHSGANDTSNPCDESYALTEQIPIVPPVRTREIEWVRGGNDDGVCIPECGDKEDFPWKVRVNGSEQHFLNANRVSNLIPQPGEVEHWTLKNGGGGWDHPIHLHTEEGVTMHRGDEPIPPWEEGVRKDVWRLREGESVTFQVRFGEYGGAYVNHCHNTVHEDNAMLLRFDTLTDPTQGLPGEGPSDLHVNIMPTPNPTRNGVVYLTPEILPEGDPSNSEFFDVADNGRIKDVADNSRIKKAGSGGNGGSTSG